MKLRVHTAMVGLAAAMLFGCSTPPEDGTGAAGTNATGAAGVSATGAAGTVATTGTAGTVATTGTAGTVATTGAAGTVATGAAGTNATGAAGTGAAGTGAAGTGAAGTGAAGTGAAGTGVSVGCPAGVKGHCNAETAAAPTYAGYTLALVEEFDVALDLDKDPIWTWSDGGPPEGQARFAKENITFAGGKMIITAQGVNVPESASYAEPARNQQTGTAHACAVKSGELRTRHNNYRYGRYEARFKAPIENGTRPVAEFGNFLSTVFTFRTPKWAEWNEIDIELEAHIKGRVAYNMVNAMGATGYPGGDAGSMVPQGTTNFSIQQFHTYAFEWTPTKVTWFVDGVMLRSNGANPPIPTNSAKIMMNLWVFGSAAAFGDPARNTYPFSSEYEWFRFYKSNTETTYPVADPRTMLPAGDVDFSRNNPAETTYPNFPMP